MKYRTQHSQAMVSKVQTLGQGYWKTAWGHSPLLAVQICLAAFSRALVKVGLLCFIRVFMAFLFMEQDGEGRAFAYFACDPNLAAMCLDNVFDDGQA